MYQFINISMEIEGIQTWKKEELWLWYPNFCYNFDFLHVIPLSKKGGVLESCQNCHSKYCEDHHSSIIQPLCSIFSKRSNNVVNVQNHITVLHLYDRNFCGDCGKDSVTSYDYASPMMLLVVVVVIAERRAQPIQKVHSLWLFLLFQMFRNTIFF